MKRSVAVLGKTPQFVRWALARPCDLRNLDVTNLPDYTFRQLRNIRELSVAKKEDRVVDGICLRTPTVVSDPNELLGFIAEEVYDLSGEDHELDDLCGSCPANTLKEGGLWTGCYGWLAADPVFSFDAPHGDGYVPKESLVSDLTSVVEELELKDRINEMFPVRSVPYWYALWQAETPTKGQLEILQVVLRELLRKIDMAKAANGVNRRGVNSVSQFLKAVELAVEHDLKLHLELVPPGFSDGQTWATKDNCPTCKCSEWEPVSHGKKCVACGRVGNLLTGRRSKVLGFRPYMKLVGILGPEKTKSLMAQYQSKG